MYIAIIIAISLCILAFVSYKIVTLPPEIKPKTQQVVFDIIDMREKFNLREIAINLIYEDLMDMKIYLSLENYGTYFYKELDKRSSTLPAFNTFYNACSYCKVFEKEYLVEIYNNFNEEHKILLLSTKKYCLDRFDGYDEYIREGYHRAEFVKALYEIEKIKKVDEELKNI